MDAPAIDPRVYMAACDSFQRAIDLLTETLTSIQGQLETSLKNQRETSLAKSSLQTKLSQTESRLKAALEELTIQRGLRHDAISMTERITALQTENAKMTERVAELTKNEKEARERLEKLESDLLDERSEKQALKEAWKVVINSYEEKIDEMRAQSKKEPTDAQNEVQAAQ